ncbi:universal stress protein [Flavobacterium gilvum]|uniref:Universal stress protein UspA n=1 Tax=Flavobacterium gilvum TaxID=1492737 RepID=A0AAC9N596_9FLAO|nr:universal stress protein [Flavobacterium gilvum]AOW09147.1 universal stress protein UspA [Flavobacterium gilvum]KFC60868.1 universal stress protein UspA [Flavobacterium gilvum]
MKKILIPTDFSKYADEAIEVGAQIAKKNGSEIILIHMLELPGQMNDAITGATSIPEVMLFKRKAEETLKSIKNRPYLNGIKITEVVRLDGAYQGINNYIKHNHMDLIIMGSHGSAGINEIIIGSNTEKVVRQSETPVLVIKNKVNEFNVQNIVFASDFSKDIKKPFQKVLDFNKLFESKLKLVMICTPNSFKSTTAARKIVSDFVSDFDMPEYTFEIHNESNIEKGILNYADEKNADLIALCTHGRTGLSHFFTGSISEDLVNHATKPVLTFKI